MNASKPDHSFRCRAVRGCGTMLSSAETRVPDGGAQRAVGADRPRGRLQGHLGIGPRDLGAVRRARQQRGELDAGRRRRSSSWPTRATCRSCSTATPATATSTTCGGSCASSSSAASPGCASRTSSLPEDEQLHRRRAPAARRRRRVLRQDRGRQETRKQDEQLLHRRARRGADRGLGHGRGAAPSRGLSRSPAPTRS